LLLGLPLPIPFFLFAQCGSQERTYALSPHCNLCVFACFLDQFCCRSKLTEELFAQVLCCRSEIAFIRSDLGLIWSVGGVLCVRRAWVFRFLFYLFVGVRVSGGTSSLHFAADRNALVTESIKQEGGGFFGLCVGVGSPSLFTTPASLSLSLSLSLAFSFSPSRLLVLCWLELRNKPFLLRF
jgi:hypothetical protein